MDRITAQSLVQDVVAEHPETISVFARRGWPCVGCYISPFHTIADVADQYRVDLDSLLTGLNQALDGSPSGAAAERPRPRPQSPAS